ncbi:hypothetical protein GCM10009603_46480 [Nocardiopsis exhalans]
MDQAGVPLGHATPAVADSTHSGLPPLGTPDSPGWHHDAARVADMRERNAEEAKHTSMLGPQTTVGDFTTDS